MERNVCHKKYDLFLIVHIIRHRYIIDTFIKEVKKLYKKVTILEDTFWKLIFEQTFDLKRNICSHHK